MVRGGTTGERGDRKRGRKIRAKGWIVQTLMSSGAHICVMYVIGESFEIRREKKNRAAQSNRTTYFCRPLSDSDPAPPPIRLHAEAPKVKTVGGNWEI